MRKLSMTLNGSPVEVEVDEARYLSEVLRGVGGLRIVFYGVFLVVFIVALPEGIFHFVQRKYNQFERWVEVDS